jgi:hypothetical protein
MADASVIQYVWGGNVMAIVSSEFLPYLDMKTFILDVTYCYKQGLDRFKKISRPNDLCECPIEKTITTYMHNDGIGTYTLTCSRHINENGISIVLNNNSKIVIHFESRSCLTLINRLFLLNIKKIMLSPMEKQYYTLSGNRLILTKIVKIEYVSKSICTNTHEGVTEQSLSIKSDEVILTQNLEQYNIFQ